MMKNLIAATVLALGLATGAQAGLLDGHADAMNSGSVNFNNGQGLNGTVEWAVFLDSKYPFGGYSPTANELVYAYTVMVNDSPTGTVSATGYRVLSVNGANNQGVDTTQGGVAGTAAGLGGNTAQWSFVADGNVNPGQTSYILTYSSIFKPVSGNFELSFVSDSGTPAVVFGAARPGDEAIPEPASLALLALGSLMIVRGRRG